MDQHLNDTSGAMSESESTAIVVEALRSLQNSEYNYTRVFNENTAYEESSVYKDDNHDKEKFTYTKDCAVVPVHTQEPKLNVNLKVDSEEISNANLGKNESQKKERDSKEANCENDSSCNEISPELQSEVSITPDISSAKATDATPVIKHIETKVVKLNNVEEPIITKLFEKSDITGQTVESISDIDQNISKLANDHNVANDDVSTNESEHNNDTAINANLINVDAKEKNELNIESVREKIDSAEAEMKNLNDNILLSADEVQMNDQSNDSGQITLSQFSNCNTDAIVDKQNEPVFNKSELLAILEGDDHEEQKSSKILDKKPLSKRKSSGKSPLKPEKTRLHASEMSDELDEELSLKKPIVIRSYGRKSSTAVVSDLVADWSEVEILEDELLEEELLKQKESQNAVVAEHTLNKSKLKNSLKAKTKVKETHKHKDTTNSNKVIKKENSFRVNHKQKIAAEEDPLKDAIPEKNHNAEPKEDTSKESISVTTLNAVRSESCDQEDNTGRRRMSRIIKKKIIWDPDNPETYKFASAALRKSQSGPPPTKEMEVAETKQEITQESPLVNEVSENNVIALKQELPKDKAKDKILSVKKKIFKKGQTKKLNSISQWGKQKIKDKFKVKIGLGKRKSQELTGSIGKKKKMTEIDRLLMDEGAVNMIYQLEKSNNKTPEDESPPNSPLNMSSKAEMIKKSVISQSTTSTLDKTFRKREAPKPKIATETPPTKKMPGRLAKSTSSRETVKSPSLFEEYATRNAESSIIIRRHSSSSYSSSCMSPRRLSDIESAGTFVSSLNHVHEGSPPFLSPQPLKSKKEKKDHKRKSASSPFLDGDISAKTTLKSKVAKVFSLKRKKSSLRPAVKQARLTLSSKSDDYSDPLLLSSPQDPFTQLSIEYEDNIARIIIDPTESKACLYNLQVLLELRRAIYSVSSEDRSRVTLLYSRDGALCGGLDPRTIYTHRQDRRTRVLEQVANAWCQLVLSLSSHESGLVCGVDGACGGIGAALLPLCDAVFASDRATIRLPSCSHLAQPGLAVLAAHPRQPHHSIVSMSALTGRPLTAAEALARGLVSRTLWPHRFQHEVHTIIAAIAANPHSSLLLTKRLLSVGQRNDVLQEALVEEKQLLVEYWSSQDGQTAIKKAVEAIDQASASDA